MVYSECPGCMVPMDERKYWPDPNATIHTDGNGRKFAMKNNDERVFLPLNVHGGDEDDECPCPSCTGTGRFTEFANKLRVLCNQYEDVWLSGAVLQYLLPEQLDTSQGVLPLDSNRDA
jgi:hypothetical protein